MIIKEMYAKATFINILKHKINWLFKIYQRFIELYEKEDIKDIF